MVKMSPYDVLVEAKIAGTKVVGGYRFNSNETAANAVFDALDEYGYEIVEKKEK